MYKPTCDCGGHIVALYQCLIPIFPDHLPICAIYLNNQSPCFFRCNLMFFQVRSVHPCPRYRCFSFVFSEPYNATWRGAGGWENLLVVGALKSAKIWALNHHTQGRLFGEHIRTEVRLA